MLVAVSRRHVLSAGIRDLMDLASVIAQIESGNNPHAMRFEPLVFQSPFPARPAAERSLITKIEAIHGCSLATAEMIYSTSWGAYQIMGMTLYDLGYAKPIMDFMTSPDDQLAMFNTFCTRRGIAFTVDQLRDDSAAREKFASRYNGPGNIADYSARIAAEIARQGAENHDR